jgi:hypothetical protein
MPRIDPGVVFKDLVLGPEKRYQMAGIICINPASWVQWFEWSHSYMAISHEAKDGEVKGMNGASRDRDMYPLREKSTILKMVYKFYTEIFLLHSTIRSSRIIKRFLPRWLVQTR